MLYLVTGEYVEVGPLLSHQQSIQQVEQMVIPSLETCVKLKAEGKILAGGVVTGERASAFVLEAESNEEVSQIVQDSPFWMLNKWKITPLDSFENRVAQVREMLKRLKEAPQ